jgi:pilus assembly protein Flp/PilA
VNIAARLVARLHAVVPREIRSPIGWQGRADEGLAAVHGSSNPIRGTAVAISPPRDAASAAHINTIAALPQLRTAYGRCSTSGEELMSMLLNYVKSFVRQEEGQDLLEYALLVALIALIAIGAVGAAGGSVNSIFQSIADELAAAS